MRCVAGLIPADHRPLRAVIPALFLHGYFPTMGPLPRSPVGDCAWPRVSRAVLALPGIGHRAAGSSPDRLILISQMLVGHQASSHSKTSRVPRPFWDFCAVNRLKWINHSSFLGQDGEGNFYLGGRVCLRCDAAPCPAALCICEVFFPLCAPEKLQDFCCALLVSLASTTPKLFISKTSAPPWHFCPKQNHRIISAGKDP